VAPIYLRRFSDGLLILLRKKFDRPGGEGYYPDRVLVGYGGMSEARELRASAGESKDRRRQF
jgi:hypothetical protein